MSLVAKVIESDTGLTIQFTATEDDEARIRRMFDSIKDDGDISKSVSYILDIAIDAAELIEKHQGKVYP